MLSDKEIDEFVTRHANTSFLWNNEPVPPEKLSALLKVLGILPCKDCKKFFESYQGVPYRDIHSVVNNGECECGRVCSVEVWNEEMKK
jgi:hypothetical protein